MRRSKPFAARAVQPLILGAVLLLVGCGPLEPGAPDGGASSGGGSGSGGSSSGASSSGSSGAGSSSGGSSGSSSSGSSGSSGGSSGSSSSSSGGSSGGSSGSGSSSSGGSSGGSSGSSGAGTGCTVGGWPAADPSTPGPFETVTENGVGPPAGTPENGTQPRFVLIRPRDLGRGGRCHPVITWGNGYGDNPPTYMVLLRQLASHGFVVIASLSRYVTSGDPPPMKVGVDWVLQQHEDPASPLYGKIDTTHVGATGHSAGGAATAKLGSDPRIGAIATICGAGANAALHGPALLLCGGQDTVATCSRMQSAFDGITSQPVMLADQLSATHGSWIGSIRDPFMIAVTAWMRLHLMGDASQRGMFYGPDCTLCRNTSVWKVQRKLMDE